jgi:hypothetical protein
MSLGSKSFVGATVVSGKGVVCSKTGVRGKGNPRPLSLGKTLVSSHPLLCAGGGQRCAPLASLLGSHFDLA